MLSIEAMKGLGNSSTSHWHFFIHTKVFLSSENVSLRFQRTDPLTSSMRDGGAITIMSPDASAFSSREVSSWSQPTPTHTFVSGRNTVTRYSSLSDSIGLLFQNLAPVGTNSFY